MGQSRFQLTPVRCAPSELAPQVKFASCAALRRQARAFVETERSWSASVGRYAPVYARLAAARRVAGVAP